MADYTFYPAIALTGGTDDALDGYDGAELNDKDVAIVVTATAFYHYILDDDSGAAESSPDVIKPDDNAGTKRWILINITASDAHTHDGRYFTETEIATWRNSVTQTEMGYLNGVTSDIQTQINALIGAAGVTYENLAANGDVGAGATQVSQGDHLHDGRYYTETEIDAWRNGCTQTEMGHLHGVSSDIQTQIDGKSATGHTHVEANITDLEHDAVKLQGRTLDSAAPSDGQSIIWDAGNVKWKPGAPTTGKKIEEGNSNVEVIDAESLVVLEGSAGTKTQCTASSQFSTDYKPEEAWDGIADGSTVNSWFGTNANEPNPDGSCYIQWNFGVQRDFKWMRFHTRGDAGFDAWPSNIKILGSNTGAFGGEEVILYDTDVPNASSMTPNSWSDWMEFSAHNLYQYLRVEIHERYVYGGVGQDWAAVQEVQFKYDSTEGQIDFDIDGTRRAMLNSSGFQLGETGARIASFVDEDDMVSDSAVKLATQQSIKKYVDDNKVSAVGIVTDTTPQLGGDLDMNSKGIDFPSTPNITDVKDEDNMVSDSATMLATQQSIKKYVDDSKVATVGIVADTTPQLGGDLDMNSKGIDFPTTANITDCLDEDTMVSDSATKLATQQSIKAYVDEMLGGGEDQVALVKTGTYTGDGTTSKAVTGVGFDPKYLRITYNAVSDAAAAIWEKTDLDGIYAWNHAPAGAHQSFDNRIISLDADGFTVDDDGIDASPNASGVTYNYIAIGSKTVQTYAALNTSSYAKVSDVKATTNAGGTFTQDAWRTRTLNTEDSDPDAICSLASNQITLTAGTYECDISCPAYHVQRHQARLYNTTGASVLILGTSEFSNSAGDYTQSCSVVKGRFTIAADQVLEVQHYCAVTQATNGFGTGSNTGLDEVYTIAEFWKIHEGGAQEGVGFNSRASASKNDSQSIPNTTWEKLELDDVEFDGLGEYDETTNHRFTANSAGYYQISVSAGVVSLSDGKVFFAAIYKDGAAIATGTVYPGSAGTPYANCSKLVYLATNSYIEVYLYQNEGGALNTAADAAVCWMTIHRVA